MIIMQFFYLIMSVAFRCEPLGNHDFQFLLDEDTNAHTIIGVGFFEKFDYISMKNYMIEKSEKIDKCRSKLVKKFGLFWFQKMDEHEWTMGTKKVFPLIQDINTEEDLKKFVCKEQANYDMFDQPQYKFYLIPDYQPDKSAFVLKIHHCMSDGQGIATLFQAFNSSYDSSNLPRMKPLSLCKKIFVYAVSPILILQTLFKIQFEGIDYNAMKHKAKLSGEKVGGYV